MNHSIIALVTVSLSLLILAGCARKAIPVPPKTLTEDITVKRDKDDYDYSITFDKKGKWTIFSNEKIDQLDWTEPLIELDGDEITFNQFEKNKRTFFGILDEEGNKRIVSERKIQLDGTPNFRDIGGLLTADGRMVNWGLIYRSSNLSELNSDDMTYIQGLNIKSVCDFRYTSEIEEDPDKLPVGATYYHFPIGGKEGVFYQQLKRKVLKEGLKKQAAKKEFIKVMEMFADSAAHDFKPVMDLLAATEEGKTPLLYHCSGGKDRTGYMTMMILATLGVEKEEIRKEYLMSNFYRYKKNKSIARKARIIGIDSETLSYILVVQDDYFDAVFGVIENKYGGLDNYLLEKYDITPEIRQQMIEKYTSPLVNTIAEEETVIEK